MEANLGQQATQENGTRALRNLTAGQSLPPVCWSNVDPFLHWRLSLCCAGPGAESRKTALVAVNAHKTLMSAVSAAGSSQRAVKENCIRALSHIATGIGTCT
jgi:hypothetical protein